MKRNVMRFSVGLVACLTGFLVAEFTSMKEAAAVDPCPIAPSGYSQGWACVSGSCAARTAEHFPCNSVWNRTCAAGGGTCIMGAQCFLLCPGSP